MANSALADPRVGAFTPQGATVRHRQIATAVRMRRNGHDYLEIGARLRLDPRAIESFIAECLPSYLADTKQWHHARRVRLLSKQERDACGPHTFRLRAKGVLEAQAAGDINVLIGSLEDLASAAINWSERLQRQRPSVLPPPADTVG